MPGNIWTRERMDYLLQSWRDGWSFSELALRLNEQFGCFLSRSSVAGKVARMKLANDERIKRAPRVRAPRAARSLAAAASPRPTPAPRVPLKPRMIDMLELSRHTCRYPYGDTPPFRYCGCPPIKGSPYCREHTSVCWNHPPLELE